ncbi:MAG TPA: hypothetical protein VK753_07470 [Xanthomonadaceae bacterium]|jgi:hypothetical protein|nr:hypothetical protein [Xanthomonadaceae bacterium]
MKANDPDQQAADRDLRLQAEAERAEREGLAAGSDPRLDRYRLVVRALRQPLEPQLPVDFAARVAAMAARRERGDGFEDWLVALLMAAMGVGALLFVVPALANAVQAMATIRLPLLPWHQAVATIVCIGVAWAFERGWIHLHPPHR